MNYLITIQTILRTGLWPKNMLEEYCRDAVKFYAYNVYSQGEFDTAYYTVFSLNNNQ